MCGVFGILDSSQEFDSSSEVAHDVYRALLSLQHRGQDAAGILSFSFSNNRFSSHKALGLVNDVFSRENLNSLKGKSAIGHTRYSTVGGDKLQDALPLISGFPIGIGMAHNGNIVNYHRLAELIKDEHHGQLLTNNDLEVFLSFWCKTMIEQEASRNFSFKHAVKAAEQIFESVEGAYGLIGLVAGEGMFGMRDPNGIRPLLLAEKVTNGKKSYALSSESLPFELLGFHFVRDILPGELIFITSEGELKSHKFLKKEVPKKTCMFEWVYFSAVESNLEKRPIYGVRRSLGERLSLKIKKLIDDKTISVDIVCPVPDTSRCAAIALSESLKLTYREGLIKNRYVQRSFILKTQEHREKAVELKLNPVRSEIAGRSILLVDDSIVRGTTSKRIIKLLKEYGAKDIVLAVTCPPIRHGCFYGIDFPEDKELIANEKNLKEIEKEIGVEKIIYLDSEDLVKAIGSEDICQACITGNYPTNVSDAKLFSTRRNEIREMEL